MYAFNFPWQQLAGSIKVKCAVALRDGSVLGLGEDGSQFLRATPDVEWVAVGDGERFNWVAQLNDGGLLYVGLDGNLYTRATPKSPYSLIGGSGTVRSAVQLRSGAIVGCGMDGNMYVRESLVSGWCLVGNSGTVQAIIATADDSLIAIGGDNFLWAWSKLACGWCQQPSSGYVICITECNNGDLLGVGTNGLLHRVTRARVGQAGLVLSSASPGLLRKGRIVSSTASVVDSTIKGQVTLEVTFSDFEQRQNQGVIPAIVITASADSTRGVDGNGGALIFSRQEVRLPLDLVVRPSGSPVVTATASFTLANVASLFKSPSDTITVFNTWLSKGNSPGIEIVRLELQPENTTSTDGMRVEACFSGTKGPILGSSRIYVLRSYSSGYESQRSGGANTVGTTLVNVAAGITSFTDGSWLLRPVPGTLDTYFVVSPKDQTKVLEVPNGATTDGVAVALANDSGAACAKNQLWRFEPKDDKFRIFSVLTGKALTNQNSAGSALVQKTATGGNEQLFYLNPSPY